MNTTPQHSVAGLWPPPVAKGILPSFVGAIRRPGRPRDARACLLRQGLAGRQRLDTAQPQFGPDKQTQLRPGWLFLWFFSILFDSFIQCFGFNSLPVKEIWKKSSYSVSCICIYITNQFGLPERGWVCPGRIHKTPPLKTS